MVLEPLAVGGRSAEDSVSLHYVGENEYMLLEPPSSAVVRPKRTEGRIVQGRSDIVALQRCTVTAEATSFSLARGAEAQNKVRIHTE